MSSGHKRPRPKSTAAEVREAEREQSRLARRHRPIPVSLGKPSLRRRLEAYYSLIAPEVVQANEAEWVRKFDLIYDKFGGSVEGERRLSSKLAKKYGETVRLLTVDDAASSAATTSNDNSTITTGCDGNDPSGDSTTTTVRPEEWFELTPDERGSGITDFASPRFDPVAALMDPDRPPAWCASDAPLLDNISKARRLLPPFDPQRLVVPAMRPDAGTKKGTGQQPQQLPALDALASKFEDAGPLSVLWRCHTRRWRVRVMIRYVDGIRGTLTGSLLGFDKHANMILRDVDEVYSPRRRKMNVLTSNGQPQEAEESNNDDRSNRWEPTSAEMEIQRRLNAGVLRRRHMKQLLVRGDNVVMVWRADEERPSSTGVVRTLGSLLAPR